MGVSHCSKCLDKTICQFCYEEDLPEATNCEQKKFFGLSATDASADTIDSVLDMIYEISQQTGFARYVNSSYRMLQQLKKITIEYRTQSCFKIPNSCSSTKDVHHETQIAINMSNDLNKVL